MSNQHKVFNRIERYKTFFSDTGPGQILATICPYTFDLDYSQWGLIERPLNSWNFVDDTNDYIEYRVKKLRCFLEYTKELDNDYIPEISASLGIGLNSAYLSGADIIVGEDTSWIHPVINDWEDMQKLETSKENKWVKVITQMSKRILELSDGDYIPSTFTHFAPIDMANALRGNQLFYDFYDDPEKVHELMSISTDAIIWLEKELRKYTGQVMGGTAVAGMWIPGGAPFLSEDNADLCSPEIYREFAFQYTQKAIDSMGGAYIHHHAKGYHVHSDFARLRGLKMLEISWDPNCPRPIDRLEEVYELNNGLPLMTRCTAKDVYENIDALLRGRIVLMLDVNSLDEGKEVMKFIRKHSKI
jgi:hypothetical protein